jgi:hypothetical protein
MAINRYIIYLAIVVLLAAVIMARVQQLDSDASVVDNVRRNVHNIMRNVIQKN